MNSDNIVDVVNTLALLVESTSSLLDQTMMNFAVIVDLVDDTRQIINERNLESGQVMEVRRVLVKSSIHLLHFLNDRVHIYNNNFD